MRNYVVQTNGDSLTLNVV